MTGSCCEQGLKPSGNLSSSLSLSDMAPLDLVSTSCLHEGPPVISVVPSSRAFAFA